MKKLLAVIAAFCAVLLGVLLWMGAKRFSPHSGTYLHSGNGSHLILIDKTPVIMNAKNVTFHGLQSGDQIFILHDGIEESYPARTGVYFLIKIGQSPYVDETVLQQLSDLGWQIDYPPVDCTNGG